MKFRSDHLLSQEEFGKLIGISRRTVQYVENGNSSRPEWLCMPLPDTMARFRALKKKHEREHEALMAGV
jgi:transcriptional regulator with XRE-family HTH domain